MTNRYTPTNQLRKKSGNHLNHEEKAFVEMEAQQIVDQMFQRTPGASNYFYACVARALAKRLEPVAPKPVRYGDGMEDA